ncbi:hypothetical protein PC128_g14349 [Phytophthora cactorum]|nr:hypothetical protein PC128_g14349 [Phytophthora cactorum]
MLLYSIALLVATAFLACVDRACVDCNSKPITPSLSAVVESQRTVPTQRFLRAYDPADVDDEERAGVVDAIKAGAANLAESAKLRIFLSKKKSGVDVLNSLKFGDNVADALVSSKVESLKKYIAMFNQKNPDEAISLIGTFTARYGDDAVAKALVSAERRGGSKVAELAKQLRAEQLSFWLDSDKSVDDVFKLLKLSSDGYKAIISRKMVVLDDCEVQQRKTWPGISTQDLDDRFWR